LPPYSPSHIPPPLSYPFVSREEMGSELVPLIPQSTKLATANYAVGEGEKGEGKKREGKGKKRGGSKKRGRG